MAARYLVTTDRSIKDQLVSVTPEQALAEYIWNSFDANSNKVDLFTLKNTLGFIDKIRILDNGDGIDYEELKNTFDLFLDSNKKYKFTPTTRGKKGKGRFTFSKFAGRAKWTTWSEGKCFSIVIEAGYLNTYSPDEIANSDRVGSGTEVEFSIISDVDQNYFNGVMVPFLKNEFTWLLISNDDLELNIDGRPLELSTFQTRNYDENIQGFDFSVQSTLWDEKQNSEKSYIYFQDENNKIIHKELSELNYKGFYCSSYVKSVWFNGFVKEADLLSNGRNVESEIFKEILSFSKSKLRQDYFDFRNSAADCLIEQYIREGVFPDMKGNNQLLNDFHRDQLISTIKVIYEAEPAVFSKSLNKFQKKVLIKLLDRIVQSNRLSELFDVLDGVVSLTEDEMTTISTLLTRTSLKNITKTIEHISDRLDIIKYFNVLVFDQKKFALEVPHIQRCVESNLWLFGEQYHLLASEEDKFEDALRELLSIRGDEAYCKKSYLSHPDKNREMDIFAAQRGFKVADDGSEYFHHIVLELKRPSIKLSDKELEQIKKYKNVIANEPKFHDDNSVWDFILVGSEISESNITSANLRAELETNRIHGEPGLVQKTGGMRIYVKTWKQILNDFELRYKDLSTKLSLKEVEIVANDSDSLTTSILELSNP